MKFNSTKPDASYELIFFFAKVSGYAFFSIRRIGNGAIEFCQTWLDYFIFIISVTSSVYAASGNAIQVFDIKLRSTILNIGLLVFWEASLICMIVTKVNNYLYVRTCFKILTDFKWMDKEV